MKSPDSCVVLALLLVSLTAIAADREERIERCRGYQQQIEQLTELRRRGGRGSQMDAWRRQRGELEDRFRAENCKRYRRYLKR
jgi:hypothetical protein